MRFGDIPDYSRSPTGLGRGFGDLPPGSCGRRADAPAPGNVPQPMSLSARTFRNPQACAGLGGGPGISPARRDMGPPVRHSSGAAGRARTMQAARAGTPAVAVRGGAGEGLMCLGDLLGTCGHEASGGGAGGLAGGEAGRHRVRGRTCRHGRLLRAARAAAERPADDTSISEFIIKFPFL
jgi:hypothetical protein